MRPLWFAVAAAVLAFAWWRRRRLEPPLLIGLGLIAVGSAVYATGLVEFPDLAARLADGRTSLILLKRVEAEMVASVMRNPKGWASESQTICGLSNSHTVNVEAASGLLKLTEAHRILIRGTSVASSSGVVSGGPYSLPMSTW